MARLGPRVWGPPACLVLLAALGACAGDGDDDRGAVTDPPSSDTTASTSGDTVAGAALPEGVYRTAPLSAADIEAAAAAGGFTRADAAVVTDLFDDSVVWELTLGEGRWTEAEIYDGAPPEVGWEGTYTVTGDHTVVATEDGGGPITYDFEVSGDELTLALAGDDALDPDNLLHQTVIYQSAPFVRRDASTAGAEQDVAGFVAPFSIELADWLDPTPSDESATFVTWEASDHSRGLRVMAPVAVYRPGEAEPSGPPADMADYLASLADAGADITDVTTTELDGHPATEMTIGLGPDAAQGSLDGAIGCPEEGQAADTCFGPQDDLVLRLVAAEVDGAPVLVWERAASDDAEALSDGTFDAMVASIHFG